jgi:hypothetical protein
MVLPAVARAPEVGNHEAAQGWGKPRRARFPA